MRLIEIAHGTTVAHHQILESPLIAEDGLQQPLGTAARIIVKTLVGTHHLTHLRILHQGLEGRHVRFPHIPWGNIREIGCMTGVFGSAVHGIVLSTSPQLTVLRIFRTL